MSGLRINVYKKGGGVHGPGTTTSDSVKVNLSKGEYVLPAKTRAAIDAVHGPGYLDKVVTQTNGRPPSRTGGLRGGVQHRPDGGQIWDAARNLASHGYNAAKNAVSGGWEGVKKAAQSGPAAAAEGEPTRYTMAGNPEPGVAGAQPAQPAAGTRWTSPGGAAGPMSGPGGPAQTASGGLRGGLAPEMVGPPPELVGPPRGPTPGRWEAAMDAQRDTYRGIGRNAKAIGSAAVDLGKSAASAIEPAFNPATKGVLAGAGRLVAPLAAAGDLISGGYRVMDPELKGWDPARQAARTGMQLVGALGGGALGGVAAGPVGAAAGGYGGHALAGALADRWGLEEKGRTIFGSNAPDPNRPLTPDEAAQFKAMQTPAPAAAPVGVMPAPAAPKRFNEYDANVYGGDADVGGGLRGPGLRRPLEAFINQSGPLKGRAQIDGGMSPGEMLAARAHNKMYGEAEGHAMTRQSHDVSLLNAIRAADKEGSDYFHKLVEMHAQGEPGKDGKTATDPRLQAQLVRGITDEAERLGTVPERLPQHVITDMLRKGRAKLDNDALQTTGWRGAASAIGLRNKHVITDSPTHAIDPVSAGQPSVFGGVDYKTGAGGTANSKQIEDGGVFSSSTNSDLRDSREALMRRAERAQLTAEAMKGNPEAVRKMLALRAAESKAGAK